MSVSIFEIPANQGVYYRLFIDGNLYSESFRDELEMKQNFAKNRKHLKGHSLPKATIKTSVISQFGLRDTHRVLEAETPETFLVTGPGGMVWDHIFASKAKAQDFANIEAGKHDGT
ncbi:MULTISPECIES: hypothetical protein [unclassified Rhizobium]|uniref:hypothetical protein n=1 Tax=unclassified Rhizobium TaxID=2613769 RepID=UPI001ADC04EB|nr:MULTISPECIES: hypothetical protein [unclassified Rhizobium]MBO9127769.1 hypothetical protein [Rhizobium sp. 16-488-2b]MBO9178231.1 hypothetical protein [Rhizobium sp. 16-488-2a]